MDTADKLLDLLREVVRAEVAAIIKPACPDAYSSAGPLPAGWSRRRFLERVRTMPEAHRVGGKRGRGVVWTISRGAWEATTVITHGVKTSNVVSIDALNDSAGYRATRTA